jgi:hypothetical protein
MTEEKNPAAVELGTLGGKKGGEAPAAKMTPEERSESARKAAKTRWEKNRRKKRSPKGSYPVAVREPRAQASFLPPPYFSELAVHLRTTS